MIVYSNTGDPINPFQQIAQLPNINDEKMSEEQKQIIAAVSNSTIKSIDISSGEDMLVFTTDNNQIYKMTVSLMDKTKVEAFYFYLVQAFHSRPISGMDVCIKKNLIATCSSDKTVKIWSYSPSLGFELMIN